MKRTTATKKKEIPDFLTAMIAAKEDALGKGFKKGKGGESSLSCPICKGVLYYSVAGYNGHMWAKCRTPLCVSWME